MSRRKTYKASEEIMLKFIGAKVPMEDVDKLRQWAREMDLTMAQVLRRIVRDKLSEAGEAVTAK
jgi:hypothetical protein